MSSVIENVEWEPNAPSSPGQPGHGAVFGEFQSEDNGQIVSVGINQKGEVFSYEKS